MQKEIWKDVPGYNGHYMVSNLGRVKSIKREKHLILKHGVIGSGYYIVCFSINGSIKNYSIHVLVAMAFLGYEVTNRKIVINHKNFIRTDNRLENLEIITARENTNLKHIKSSSKYIGVHWYKKLNKWRSAISINGKIKHLGYFIKEYDAHLAYQNKLNTL